LLDRAGVDVRHYARSLGARQERSGQLVIVGVPDFEPWHFTAHLSEQAARSCRDDLMPTLLRWEIPAGAPPHLARSVDELRSATSGQTVLAIEPVSQAPELLERIDDARRRGARILSLHRDDADLMDLSHETLAVDRSRPQCEFDVTQHLLTDLTPLSSGRRTW
jgi:hypothetical protein